jgi:hypothetical protein
MINHPKAPLIVAHHFNDAGGIGMKLVDDVWELTSWPEGLGPEPTDADVASWLPAYEAAEDAKRQLRSPPPVAATSMPELVAQVEAIRLALVDAGILEEPAP